MNYTLSLALLSGGRSLRMGQDKALMPFLGRPLILRILERLRPSVAEVLVSTNHPEDYAFLGLPLHPDLKPGCGALGGLATVLAAARHPLVAAVACDMPFASAALLEHESRLLFESGADVAIPSTPEGLEPLHAVYRRDTCLPVVRAALEAGEYKMTAWLEKVVVHRVEAEEIARFDPGGLAFWNLNTPEDFRLAEERARVEE